MRKIWQTIRGYIWWTHERGSFHYDVMVTLILLFIFATPFFVNFKDKPAERRPRPRSVLVLPDGENGLVFRVDAMDVKAANSDEVQAELQRIIEPISGYVKIKRWAADKDLSGNVVGYHVWVRR
jgi:hypothetical protein